MTKPDDPRVLAVDLLPRSICSVQVTAVITDAGGSIISWGWNNVGRGFGQHAEAHAISRANKDRLWYGTIYVAALRNKTGNPVLSRPCEKCQELLSNWKLSVVYRTGRDIWIDGL